ncbi:MAG: TIGR00730 family Rossman fold protein [Patescibacteria group bacterium]
MKQINLSEKEINNKPLTIEEIEKQKSFFNKKLNLIENEFRAGFNFIKKQPKSVTFFGSARAKEGDKYYQASQKIAEELSKNGYTIVTGGGPGVMEAANRGAFEQGNSVGYCIRLPEEQITNPYVNKHLNFHYFFIRKVMLTFSAQAFVYFPGGFGTMDEFFEILTLLQTDKIKKVPIILFGSEYWNKIDSLIKNEFVERFHSIDIEDTELYTITDDINEVLKIIKSTNS